MFLTSPEIMVDWAPGAWLYNSLHIDRLESPLVRVERLPKLRKTGRKGPLLPKFDIHIGSLKIDRLELARGVSGTARTGSLSGEADIRAGRAMIGLQLGMLDGDKLAARLDAEPDRNRFDVDVRAIAPRDGLLPALVGLEAADRPDHRRRRQLDQVARLGAAAGRAAATPPSSRWRRTAGAIA